MSLKIIVVGFAIISLNSNNFNCNKSGVALVGAAAVGNVSNQTTSSSAQSSLATTNLQQNYASLREDVRWFFERLENLAATVELMLPNATATGQSKENRTLVGDTRLILLSGIRHLVVGTKELSTTFRKSFETDHVRQFLQLKQVTNFIHELIKTLKIWFGNIRALVSHLFTLYNYYIPEVLFGKCMGKYIVTAYPERNFYEYPLLLITDIFNILLDSIESESDNNELASRVDKFDDPLANEIPQSEQDDLTAFAFNVAGYDSTDAATTSSTSSSSTEQSIFNLSDVVATNKEAFIDRAAEAHSLKQCLKLYTAETLIRQLKLYFLS